MAKKKNSNKAKRYSKEFKVEAVKLVTDSDKTRAEVDRDLGISGSAIYTWMKQAGVDNGGAVGVTTDEREELRHLRKEVRVLRQERDILKNMSGPRNPHLGIRNSAHL